MVELLEICRKQYDMILIDTPPALQITDARVLGRLSDAVIFVARANSTTRDALSALSKRFSDDRIRVIGAILNDWDPKKSRGGYYGYRGNYGYKYSGYNGYSYTAHS
jgi:Mrp family chromosome partitioning ATPase